MCVVAHISVGNKLGKIRYRKGSKHRQGCVKITLKAAFKLILNF